MDRNYIIAGLNPAQLAAVEHTGRPLLVLSGSGTGKTHVLARRIMNLTLIANEDPSRLMAVTFTRKAAEELKERLAGPIGMATKDMFIGTFHALSHRILRAHPEHHGASADGFTIVDEDDARLLVGHILDSLDDAAGAYSGAERDRRIKRCLAEIDRLKTAGIDITKFADTMAGWPAGVVPPAHEAKAIAVEYAREMQRSHLLDYTDLLVHLERMFAEHPDLHAAYRARFRHILVDEYQDTDGAQERWIKLFTTDGSNLCCFGDDDQSIYGWRGAQSDNILTFHKRYPNARVITLTVNYRCPNEILKPAATMIRNNARFDKKTVASKQTGGSVTIEGHYGNKDLAARITEIAHEHKKAPQDLAILTRTNAQAERVYDALIKDNLPVYRFNPNSDMSPELKDYLAWLKLMANPADSSATLRLLSGFAGAEVARAIYKKAQSLKTSIIDYLRTRPAGQSTNAGVVAFLDAYKLIRSETALQPTDKILTVILQKTGIEARLSGLTDGARTRILRQHTALMMNADDRSLSDIVASCQIEAQDLIDRPEGTMVVSTMHGMKGLEAPVIVAHYWSQGDFPSEMDTASAIEEARRLAYVTITRASRSFIALYDEQKGPSPFLREMGLVRQLASDAA